MKELRPVLFGDRAFYRMVLAIAIPIMVQQGITNFVNLLDNIMVGAVGTLPMSGVSIANQLILISNLGVFGSLTGVGIFNTQYCGKGDREGMQYCLRLKLYVIFLISAVSLLIYLGFGRVLIGSFLQSSSNDPREVRETL